MCIRDSRKPARTEKRLGGSQRRAATGGGASSSSTSTGGAPPCCHGSSERRSPKNSQIARPAASSGSALRLHPLLVIFGLLAGGEIYGLPGALVALALLAAGGAIWEFFGERVSLES